MNVDLTPAELTLLMKWALVEFGQAYNPAKNQTVDAAQMKAAQLLHEKLQAHRWFAEQAEKIKEEFRVMHTR